MSIRGIVNDIGQQDQSCLKTIEAIVGPPSEARCESKELMHVPYHITCCLPAH